VNVTTTYYNLTHGWHGFVLAYGVIAVFSLAGLKRGQANARHYLFWPITSLFTLVAIAILLSVMWMITSHYGLTPTWPIQNLLSVIVLMMGGAFGGLYWATRGRPLQPLHARGAVVFDGADAQKQTRKLVKWNRNATLTVAGVAVPEEDETKHFKFMGTTGSGKSTVMRELLDGALKRGDRAIIADPDGGYLSRFYNPNRGDVILNPFDRRSAKWNLFAELQNAYDVDQLARAFIPDRGSSDTTWTSYARTFFSSVLRQAQIVGVKEVGELYRLLTAARRDELKVILEGTPAAPFLEEGSEKLFGGVRSTTTDHVKSLDYVRGQRGEAFAVRDWVKSGSGVLFLPYQADQIATLKSIISTWMRLAIFQTMSLGEGDHRIWFAVDELDALGPIDGLSDALTRLRKFGGRCGLGFQSISQVSTTYGHGVAQAMVENCGNSLVLRCSASENGGTSRFASRLIGEREVLRLSKSVSRSRGEGFFGNARDTHGQSEQTATEVAVMPAEIEQLPDRTGFLKFTSQAAWMKVTFPYFDVPKVAQAFEPL
jgi:type IV secretory pathway TraG/TraD family ATPase VirD4